MLTSVPRGSTSWHSALRRGTVVEVLADDHHRAPGVASYVLRDPAHEKTSHPAEPAAEALVSDNDKAGDQLFAQVQDLFLRTSHPQVGLFYLAPHLPDLFDLRVEQPLGYLADLVRRRRWWGGPEAGGG